MENPSIPGTLRHHRPLDLPYRALADEHWSRAGSTRTTGRPEAPDRRPTRTSGSIPLNLDVYTAAVDFDTVLADFAGRFGEASEIPANRTALAAYAADVAATSEAAAYEYHVAQFAAGLRTALLLGDAEDVLAGITCPRCLCWATLVGIQDAAGEWRLTCNQLRCANDPGPDGRLPRTWSVHRIARHYLRHCAA